MSLAITNRQHIFFHGNSAHVHCCLSDSHDGAEGDDTSSIPESIASDASDQGPSTVVDNDVKDASNESALNEIPEADKQALQSDTSSNSDAAEPDDESADQLAGHLLASCAMHTCFILKAFECV